jgi:hypothetical protein
MNISVQFDSLEEMAAFAAFVSRAQAPATSATPAPAPAPEVAPAPQAKPEIKAVEPVKQVDAFVSVTPALGGMRFVIPDPIVHIDNNVAPAPVAEPAPAAKPRDFVLPATEPEGEKKKRGRPKKLADAPDTGPSKRPEIQEIPAGHAHVISGGANLPTISRMAPIEFDEDEGAEVGTDNDEEAVKAPAPKVQFSITPTVEEEEREVEEGLAALTSDVPERKILTKDFRMDPQIYETPKIGVAMEDAIAYLKTQGASIDDVTTFILENAGKFKAFPKANPGENTIRKFVQGKF